jgi:hypothetical protein
VTREWRAAAPLNELGVASQRALLRPDGSIVLGDREPVDGPDGVTVMVWEPVLLAPDAAPADARPIGTFPDDRTWRTRGPDGVGRTLRAPFGHAIWTAASPDGAFFLTPKPAWEVLRYGSDGRLASVIRAAVPRARIPDDSLEARARRAAEATRLPLAEIRAAFERLGPLDSLPAIGGILAAPDRHLGVERYDAGTGGPAAHDVIDAEGRWVTTVRIPRAVGELAHVGRDRVYLRWKDELEVPYLRVYELRRGG